MQEQVCKNCGNNFKGKFCNNCGEKVYGANDKKIAHLFEEAFHFLTHFEGKFFTTFKTILLKPGKLSLDYCYGIRKKYFKPLSFFLLLVVIYLIFPLLDGLNSKLFFHLKNDTYGAFAQQKVDAIISAKGITFESLSDSYHQKSKTTSKILLFTIMPFMALVSWLVAFKKRKYYFDHFIFAIENTCLLLLWGCFILPLLLIIGYTLVGQENMSNQWLIGIPLLLGMFLYTFVSSKRFFQFNILYTLLYT
ncbi:MAG: DUF3667 domain-containing protein, partial [Sphingobacteriales bacterium]